jgi:dephospho-CoA kinase
LTAQTDVKGKIVIGLTGNIATGKSAVLRLAAGRGALIVDADKIVHDILNEDKVAQEAIAETFGERLRLENGRIDRAALGEIVFNNAEALAELEQIVHPRVGARIVALLQESAAEVVMIEAIKLLEGQLWRLCREIWVTTCSYECQLQRLEVCRGMERSAAEARIKAQRPAEEKIARADVVLDTNGLMQDTERQFAQAWSRLMDQ